MIDILIDHNILGHAALLFSSLPAEEWNAYGVGRFLRLHDAGLSGNSSDREIWRRVQEQKMLLLTGNRTMDDPQSLERAWREEGNSSSLPVITVADLDRILSDSTYRYLTALCLTDVVLSVKKHLGTGRVWIPF